MANLGGTFDATSVEPNAPLEALPPGDYNVQILQRDAGHQGRHRPDALARPARCSRGRSRAGKLFDRLNLINARTQTAEEIAQRTLSAICHAIGKLQVAGQRGAAPDPDDRRRDGQAAEERLQREHQGATCRSSRRQPARQPRPRRPAAAAGRASQRPRRRPAASPTAPWKRSADPAAGSAVADRVWRHGGDGAFPHEPIRENVHGSTEGRLVPARARRARPSCRRPAPRPAPG